MKIRFLGVALLSLLYACDTNKSPETRTSAASAVSPQVGNAERLQGKVEGIVGAPPPGVADRREAAQERGQQPISSSAIRVNPTMIIRNGQASVEVDKLDPAIARVRQLATQLGGYVANSAIAGGRDQVRTATLELKIPAVRFDQAINGLGGIGKVESVNATAEDVGEEFVDISARVANAKRLEARLIDLLGSRTGRLQDVLSVERELARVREEIERYEGRLRYLSTRVAESTLSVTVHEPFPILGSGPGQNPIVGALKQAWRNFVAFVAWTIAALGIIVPLGVIAFAGWVAYRRFVRKG